MVKPWLWLPSKLSHDLSPFFLKNIAKYSDIKNYQWRSLEWQGLKFQNPLGISGGVDKNAESIEGWWTLGAGFIEVGTVTPKPQRGHTGKVIDRSIPQKALWNKMGFPNKGAAEVSRNLSLHKRPYHSPIFVNVGKNKTTPNEKAYEDYISCMKSFAPLADAFVINVSSPNTEGLRELIKEENLSGFLHPLMNAKAEIDNFQDRNIPLLLKISPDISSDELKRVLDVSLKMNVNGWVLTNTSSALRTGLKFSKEGGVSGGPLKSTSLKALKTAKAHLGHAHPDKLIISSGGILSPADIFERLNEGANLVQVYAALVFEGPMFFRQVAKYAESQT